MIAYYYIATGLALINLVLLVLRDFGKSIGLYFKMIFFVIFLANLGYLAVGVSNDLPEILLANKIAYLGGCFLPPLMCSCMCLLCNIHLNRWLKCGMYLYSGFVYILVLTTGYSDYYYSSCSLSSIMDASTLLIEKGPGYKFFYLILYGYIFADMALIVYAVIKRRVSEKYIVLLSTIQVVTVSAFLVGRAVDPLFEVMPAIYVADGFLLMLLQNQAARYNLSDSITEALELNNREGFIFFDQELDYIGSNEIAAKCIPALSECRIDHPIPEDSPAAFLYDWLVEGEKPGDWKKELRIGDLIYEGEVRKIRERGRDRGCLILLRDSTEHRKYLDILHNYNSELEQRVRQQTEHITEIQRTVTLGIAELVGSRDGNTGGHVKRTSDVVMILLHTIREKKILDLTNEFVEDMNRAAPMHDLGKVAIDDRILRKPGRFTPEEYEIMKTHAEKSAEICESLLRGVEADHFVDIAVNVARYHHEKWDGSGYPMHLAGKQIPLCARIMAVADVYDALVSRRCYKEPMSFEQAAAIMLESMGTHFDPALKEVFLFSREKLEQYYLSLTGEEEQ